MNSFKTFALMVGLTLILMLVGNLVYNEIGMIIAFIMAMGMNLITYWFSDKIVLMMYGAKPVSEEEAPQLYRLVNSLAMRAGIPMPKLYVIPQASPNAFATGRDPKHSAVAVTEGLLSILSPEEIEGVIGHELGHVKNRDILISTIAAGLAGAIMIIARMAGWAAMIGGYGRSGNNRGNNPLFFLFAIIVAPIAALLIQLAISRSREYKADETGAEIAGNPMYLSNALKKLHFASSRMPMPANEVTAHMFIVNPLRGGLVSLFSTHPRIEDRVARLEEMAAKQVKA